MADNPFSVRVPNVMEALMAGEQGYKSSQDAQKEQALTDAGQLYAAGNVKGALARAAQSGNLQALMGLSGLENQNRSFGLQEKQFGESSRHNLVTEGLTSAAQTEARRQHDVAEQKPMSVAPGASLINPKTKEVVYQGSNGLSEAANEISARQIINGDLSSLTNIGKGAQSDVKLTAIKNKAAEILTTEYGMSPTDAANHLSTKLQAFKASQIGQSAEARTGATREANLNIILKAAEAAIPAALEASDAVERYAGAFVPLNKIIQKGQIMTSNPALRRFGMANLQLAEHWARAMNPTGVMRESDRDMALSFLSTADSKETYRSIVGQLKLQITMERDAIKGSQTHGGPPEKISTAPEAATPPGPPSTAVDWRFYFGAK